MDTLHKYKSQVARELDSKLKNSRIQRIRALWGYLSGVRDSGTNITPSERYRRRADIAAAEHARRRPRSLARDLRTPRLQTSRLTRYSGAGRLATAEPGRVRTNVTNECVWSFTY